MNTAAHVTVATMPWLQMTPDQRHLQAVAVEHGVVVLSPAEQAHLIRLIDVARIDAARAFGHGYADEVRG